MKDVNAMKVGDKVVCVCQFILRPIDVGCVAPIVNEIYTVRDICTTDYLTTIRLKEIINPVNKYSEGTYEVSFDIRGFRPIDYTFGEETALRIEKEIIEIKEPVV